MGGKSSQSTQQISIPPEVLARYNAVNARAETAAQTPFQQYSSDPNAFVAPLTATQQAGIANTNYYAGSAQPYYANATQQLLGAQGAAVPYYAQATQGVGQAQDIGGALAGLSMASLYGGQQAAAQPQRAASAAYNQAYAGSAPYQDVASQYMQAGAQNINPQALGAEQINQYMSPYLGSVLQGTAAMQNQLNQQAMAGQTGNAIRQGAFGGDRAGIAAANLAQQQQLANAKTFSDIINQGYGQALTTAQQQQQLGLGAAQANRAAQQQAAQQALGIGQQEFAQGLGYGQAQAALGQQLYGQGAGTAQQIANLGQQQFGQGLSAAQQQAALGAGLYGMGSQTAQGLANLGVGAQAAGLQGAQAQLAAGQAQQQTQQAGLQALYNQFLQKQSYPFQVAQFLANIAEGTGALSGSTTTTNQAMGGFSDKRLKENIRPVGKTFDGQNIYSYNFKGDPQTQIGLMAQEVEKHHPEAVGLAGGYKTVRYDKATDDAADRGHFASGGSAMGGGVMPYHAGEGFFDGGSVGFDPGLMQQILQSYQQMYAPMQGQKGGLGAAGYVPEASGAVGQLMTSGELPGMMSPTENAQAWVDLGTGATNLYDRFRKKKSSTPAAEERAYGGLAGARHGYATDGEVEDDSIVVKAPKQQAVQRAPEPVKVPSAAPAPAQLAPVAKVDMAKSTEKPYFKPVGLNIPQIGNTVGLATAPGLSSLTDSTGQVLQGIGSIASAFAARGGRMYADGGEVDDDTAPGMNIPMQGNAVGLAGAPGLSNLTDSTGSYLQGIGDIASAGKDIFGKKPQGEADGGEIEGDDFNPIAGIERKLNPMSKIEEILSGSTLVEPGMYAAPHHEQGLAAAPAPMRMPERKAGLAPSVPQPPMGNPPVIRGGTGVRSVRNNNPGNIEDGSFARKMPGYAGTDGRFAVFKTPGDGRNAQIALIGSYIQRGYNTPAEIANRWAPGAEAGNNPNSYAAAIARNLGIGVNDPVPPSAAHRIADAQTLIEGGHKALEHFMPGRAMGGLAGRHGYATDGFVEDADPEAVNKSFDETFAPAGGVATPDVEAAPSPPAGVPDRLAGRAPEEAQRRPGLAPAGQTAPVTKRRGVLGEIAHGDFVSGLGKGKSTSWIPLLTGLATWGTIPTRSALSGVLAGLGAGAQAAQAQREFGRQQQETGIRGYQAQTQRQQLPISQKVADAQMIAAQTGNTNALEAIRSSRLSLIRQMEATGTNTATNPAYQQALAEYQAANKAIQDAQKLQVAPTTATGKPEFLGQVDLSDPYKAQRTAMGLELAGLPGGVPSGVASTARETGRILTPGGVQEVPGYAGTTANIGATVQGAQEATTTNREAYTRAQENWHTAQSEIIPVLQQIPEKLPETGLGGSALSNLASAVRVFASTQGYDASGINGDDPRSVVNAAGAMLGVPVSADNPTASVGAIVKALKRRVVQMSRAARASSEWAKKNTNPATGRPDFSRGNVTDEISKALAGQ